MSLTPHPASSCEVALRAQGSGGEPTAGHPSTAFPPQTPALYGQAGLRIPRTSRSRAARPPSFRSRATLRDPAEGPPHLSAGLAKPRDLLHSSRLREPPPGHPPALWRRRRRRRRRLRSERAPPCTGQGGRRARRLSRGAGALGRREVPVSYRAARAGHPGSGRGAGGRSPGARPRGRAPPRGARGRPAPEPREEGTGGDGGGPQRPGLPARAPPRGARAACQISGGQGCTTAPRGDSRSAGAYAPPVCPLHTDTPAGKCGRSLQFCRPGEGELPEPDTEAPVRSALTLPSPSLAPERRHSWPVHPLHVPGFPPMPRPGRLPFEKPPCVVALVLT